MVGGFDVHCVFDGVRDVVDSEFEVEEFDTMAFDGDVELER